MPNRANWKQEAQKMRKESRAVAPPTYQLGFGEMPDIPDHYPHNPTNRAQLQQKLAYQQALKARQGWLNTGNRPGQNYPAQQPIPQTPATPAPQTPQYPGVQLPQPRPRRNENKRGRYPSVTY